MYWIILLVLLAVGLGWYAWSRKIKSPAEFTKAVKGDVEVITEKLSPASAEVKAAANAYRRRRRYY